MYPEQNQQMQHLYFKICNQDKDQSPLFYKGVSLKCILKNNVPANIKRENNINRAEIWFIFYINEF